LNKSIDCLIVRTIKKSYDTKDDAGQKRFKTKDEKKEAAKNREEEAKEKKK
jgi:hypothetical protein